jgi:hypothetical protein
VNRNPVRTADRVLPESGNGYLGGQTGDPEETMFRFASVFACLVLGGALTATACKVINPNHGITQKAEDHPATYHGTVQKSEEGTACGVASRLFTLKLIKAFGAAAMPGESVVVSSPTGDCGSNYAIGTEVVIFVDTPTGCTGPGSQTTGEASFNEVSPSKAQLDSLYQRPTAVATPAEKPDRAPGVFGNRRGMTFSRTGREPERRTDGRAIAP